MSISPSTTTRDELAEQLDGFSQAALKKIAQTLGVPPRSADRSSYLEAIADFIGTPRHLQILRARLPDRQWAILDLLPLRAGPVSLRSLFLPLRKLGAEPGTELNQLSTLMSYGCLLPDGRPVGSQHMGLDSTSLNTWISTVWFDVPTGVRDWVRERFPDSHRIEAAEPPTSIVAPDLGELRRATYLIIAEAIAKPIKMTTTGVPYKTELTRLANALAGIPLVKGKGSRANATAPSPLLWFVLAALLGADLLRIVDQQIYPAPTVESFQALPLEGQIALLLSGWVRGLYDDLARIPTIWFGYDIDPNQVLWADDSPYDDGPPTVNRLLSARLYVVSALSLAVSGASNAWYNVADLATMVHETHPDLLFNTPSDYELLNPKLFDRSTLGRRAVEPYPGIYRPPNSANPREDRTLYPDRDWPLVEGGFVRQLIAEPLRWLGLVEVGPSTTAPERFRLTALGRNRLADEPFEAPEAAALNQSPDVVVQPNFEVVVVDALASTAVLAQLDVFAERRNLDRAATYHLSQAALLRGLDRGWTGARVLETLTGLNRGPIPQNVRFTLQEWIRLYERLTLRESVTLLEADSPAQLDNWLATRDIAPLLGKRLGPTSILVPAVNLEQVSAYVRKKTPNLMVVDYTHPRRGGVEVRDPDLIVADASDPYLDYRLRAFSTAIHHERSHVTYQITAESVGAGRRDGRSGQELVKFLQNASAGELPVDLTVRLFGWSGNIVPLTRQPVIALYAPSATVNWDLVARIPSIARLIQNIAQPTIALVTSENVEPLLAELAQRGLMVQPGILPSDVQRLAATPTLSPLDNLSLVSKAIEAILGEKINRLGDVDLPWPIFRLKKP